MHTIKESSSNSTVGGSTGSDYDAQVVPAVHPKTTAAEASTVIIGMIIPLLTQVGHAH